MKAKQIYHSPVICYEVTEENSSYGVSVYYSTHGKSDNPQLCCVIKNLTSNIEKAHTFAKELANSCALPIHVPELAEEFLSL